MVENKPRSTFYIYGIRATLHTSPLFFISRIKFTCVCGGLWKSTLRSKDKLSNVWTLPHVDGQQKAILRLLDHLTTWTSCNEGSYEVRHYCKVLTSRLRKRLGSEDKVWKMVNVFFFFNYNSVIRRNLIFREIVFLNRTCCWQWLTFRQPVR